MVAARVLALDKGSLSPAIEATVSRTSKPDALLAGPTQMVQKASLQRPRASLLCRSLSALLTGQCWPTVYEVTRSGQGAANLLHEAGRLLHSIAVERKTMLFEITSQVL